LRFLVQSCKYDFKNQKRTSNVQYFGLSKFLLKILPPINFVVKHPKPQKNFKIAFFTDLSQRCPPPASTAARLLTTPPAMTPLHSYLLENNQKVALPQQVELKMELLHFH